MIYLDLEDLLRIAARVVGDEVQVRDAGLLESAAHRPRTTVFGADAYPDVHDKAAALLHSVVSNHALVDGNKRLGLAAVIAFLGLNGWRLTLTQRRGIRPGHRSRLGRTLRCADDLGRTGRGE